MFHHQQTSKVETDRIELCLFFIIAWEIFLVLCCCCCFFFGDLEYLIYCELFVPLCVCVSLNRAHWAIRTATILYYSLFIFQSWQRSQSLKVDFLPLVQNVTYYNILDRISFSLNLTHNQSVSVDITKNIKVVLSSQYLTPVENSLQTQVGSVAGVSYNSSSISFDITSLTQSDLVSVSFMATVTASIHPLANLYFTVLVWGQNSGDSYLYYGPIPSQPTQYAVFPKVTLTRTSVSCKYQLCCMLASPNNFILWLNEP